MSINFIFMANVAPEHFQKVVFDLLKYAPGGLLGFPGCSCEQFPLRMRGSLLHVISILRQSPSGVSLIAAFAGVSKTRF